MPRPFRCLQADVPRLRGLIARCTRSAHVLTALALGFAFTACSGGETPTAAERGGGSGLVRLAVTANVVANAGSIVEAVVSYVPPAAEAPVVLADDSMTVSIGTNAALSVSANVGACLADAARSGTVCSVRLTMRLLRDGRLLDETTRDFTVTGSTRSIDVPALELLEVATVRIEPAGVANLEPGDTRTLVATALDRSGATVSGRTTTWELVSGGVTLTAQGVLHAVTQGPAAVRASMGGRSVNVPLTVGPASVASLDLAPLDTSISAGGTVSYRVVARSASGDALPGRAITFTSSNGNATAAGNVVTGVSAGQTTITATSNEGRGGSTVTATATLRIDAAPPILLSVSSVVFDSVPSNTSSPPVTVAVTTTPGRQINGLRIGITYLDNVPAWLTPAIAGVTTPTSFTLQANTSLLTAGVYTADVQVTSTTDPHQPATLRVTLRVLGARRVVLNPKTLSFGPLDPTQTGPTIPIAVSSATTVTLTGLAASTEYIGTATGWLTATLESTTAAPSTVLFVTPRPAGLAAGVYSARVIVSSTSLGAGPDTLLVNLTISSTQGRFSGLVQNAVNAAPLPGVTVAIRRADNTQVDLVTTGTDGRWTSNAIAAGTYSITFSASGFLTSTLLDQPLAGGAGTPVRTLPTTQLVPLGSGSGTITGTVRDATTNVAVATATVELRSGANNVTGPVIATVTSSTNGGYVFAAQSSGTYTVRATRTSYTDGSVTVTVPGTNVVAPVLFLSPTGTSIAWRFVLSWGSSPSDLDSHLTGPIAGSANRFHVFFESTGSLTASPFARLDVDVTNGGGPETITIAQQTPGVYRYFVDNYSGESEIRTSNARVDVYQGNSLVNQFFPPQQTGEFWSVFEINGAVLTPIQTIGNTPPSVALPAGGSQLRSDSPAARAAAEWFNLMPSDWKKPAGRRRR